MRKKKVLLITVVVIIIVIAIIFAIIKIVERPAIGTVYPTINTSTIGNSQAFNLAPIHVSDSYASFNYPASLKPMNNSPNDYPQVANYNYSYTGTGNDEAEEWQLAITIVKNSDGNLNNNSSYLIRKQNPSEYSQSVENINGLNIYIMSTKTNHIVK